MEIPEPMVAVPVEEWALPEDGSLVAEPKWDGWRALCGRFEDGAAVIRSRRGTDLTPGFPEVAAALAAQLPPGSLVDGELVVWAAGRLDFGRLSARLGGRPARVAALVAREPASLIVFDVLRLGGRSLTAEPYEHRREVLEDLFVSGAVRPPLNLCPSTSEAATARAWLEQWAPDTIEGLVLKPSRGTYRPGRGGWRKWRVRDTREAVVGAVTGAVSRPGIALLGRWDAAGRLRYLGRTARLSAAQAVELGAVLRSALPGHPWEGRRFSAAWGSHEVLAVELVAPEVVAEVSADASRVAGGGWRHSVRWVRLRPDLSPEDLPPVKGRDEG
ncbi:ATP-dependent DNA ligase [Streptomyces sp. NPDC004031]